MDDEMGKMNAPGERGNNVLSLEQINSFLASLPGWQVEDGRLVRLFRFRDHFQAVAFVNAVAWISHREDHHPQILLGFNTVQLSYWTHSIGGLSQNDFLCAAMVDRLFEEGSASGSSGA